VYPADYALTAPDRPALIMTPSGNSITYEDLTARGNQFAHLLADLGLRRGDHYAVIAENNLRYCEVVWGGLNSGLYVTPVNWHLTAAEAAYIIEDCGADLLMVTNEQREMAEKLVTLTPSVRHRLMIDGSSTSYDSYEGALSSRPATPILDETRGHFMFYTSGITGRPRGVQFPLADEPARMGDASREVMCHQFDLREGDVLLVASPMYHSAGLRNCQIAQCTGATVVSMDKFDPEGMLAAIEKYRVTQIMLVPTMFVRLLRLDEATRAKYDLSSLRLALHAAAPCPPEVKRAMIDWWGPILVEQYGGTEGIGSTYITSAEWLERPGSVGRGWRSTVRICDMTSGDEAPAGQVGDVYFERTGYQFAYHNDSQKTLASHHPGHADWRTMGDIGYLDDKGYLFLTDRRAHTIVSGGVNIYPREIEDLLLAHPALADVAVFGVPNDEFGEEVKAVVQPADFARADSRLALELIDHCRSHIAHFKCPRSIDFESSLPRLDNGKLYKQELKSRYWPANNDTLPS